MSVFTVRLEPEKRIRLAKFKEDNPDFDTVSQIVQLAIDEFLRVRGW